MKSYTLRMQCLRKVTSWGFMWASLRTWCIKHQQGNRNRTGFDRKASSRQFEVFLRNHRGSIIGVQLPFPIKPLTISPYTHFQVPNVFSVLFYSVIVDSILVTYYTNRKLLSGRKSNTVWPHAHTRMCSPLWSLAAALAFLGINNLPTRLVQPFPQSLAALRRATYPTL